MMSFSTRAATRSMTSCGSTALPTINTPELSSDLRQGAALEARPKLKKNWIFGKRVPSWQSTAPFLQGMTNCGRFSS